MFNNRNTALVVTDPQVEFLKPAGKGFGLTAELLEKVNTTPNLLKLWQALNDKGYLKFISPHYFYPQDHKWQFGGAGEKMMLDQEMFARDSQYTPVIEGSGADFIAELKPLLDDKTIISGPHKIFGPQNNELKLQLRKNGISQVILAGMNANLCVESHLRDLVEAGFDVVVANDAVGAPGDDAYNAALVNFGFIASASLTTDEVIAQL